MVGLVFDKLAPDTPQPRTPVIAAGLKVGCSEADITAAYRKLALKHHPVSCEVAVARGENQTEQQQQRHTILVHRYCHYADAPSPVLLKNLLQCEGVQQNDGTGSG